MFADIKKEVIEKCYQDITNNAPTILQNLLNKLKEELSLKDFEKGIKTIIEYTLGNSILARLDDKETERVLVESVKNFLEEIPDLKKSYVFSIELEGLNEEINRVVEVPSSMNLADFCYVVLGMVESQGSHLFQIKYKKIKYDCDVSEDDVYFDEPFLYASEFDLTDLNLRKNSKMELLYDFGDNYNFLIKLIEVKKHQRLSVLEDIKVLSGSGYGIWEDAHYEMSMYYHDNQEFAKFINDNDLNEDWFPIRKKLNLEDLNAHFLEKFFMLKEAYTYNEDL